MGKAEQLNDFSSVLGVRLDTTPGVLKRFDELFGISLDTAPDEAEHTIMLPALKNAMEEKANRLRNLRGEIDGLVSQGAKTLDAANEAIKLLRVLRSKEKAASEWFSLAVSVLEKFQFPTKGWDIEVKPMKTPSKSVPPSTV